MILLVKIRISRGGQRKRVQGLFILTLMAYHSLLSVTQKQSEAYGAFHVSRVTAATRKFVSYVQHNII
jgi:hypothetical protein